MIRNQVNLNVTMNCVWVLQSMTAMLVECKIFWKVEFSVDSDADVTEQPLKLPCYLVK